MPIPPSIQQQQAMAAQRAMMPRPNPQDALLQALSAQALQGDAEGDGEFQDQDAETSAEVCAGGTASTGRHVMGPKEEKWEYAADPDVKTWHTWKDHSFAGQNLGV